MLERNVDKEEKARRENRTAQGQMKSTGQNPLHDISLLTSECPPASSAFFHM